MTTQKIINDMRSHTITPMHAAADRLEELQREKEGLLNETDRLRGGWGNAIEVIGKLEDHIADLKAIDKKPLNEEMVKLISGMNEANAAHIKPEPSRLEIAAMLMQGWAANPSMESITDDPVSRPISAALEITDALIAAAKEVK